MAGVPSFDLFLSFHPSDAGPARRLLGKLEATGLRCAGSETERHVDAGLNERLPASKAFLAYASEAYFQCRACQLELAAAFIASSREPPSALERLLLINAEPGSKHIYPVHLRELIVSAAPGLPDASDPGELSESLRDHCESLRGTLGQLCPMLPPPSWEAGDGLSRAGPRFEGRERELWDIQDAFQPPGGEPGEGTSTIVVSGGGGQGKSALAREFAYRFGPAYPGGVFRLSAAEARPLASVAELAQCPPLRLQLAALLQRYGGDADTVGLDVPALLARLGERLKAAGRPFLWIVDDLPDGLNGPAFRIWLAPPAAAPWGRTLVLTRAHRYQRWATVIHLPPLDADSALRLLTRDAPPQGAAEQTAVAGLLRELGRHAMGLAIAGELAQADRRHRHRRYGNLWRKLDDHGPAAEELVSQLPGAWPQANEVSIASVLLYAIDSLDESGRDWLRLANLLPDAGLTLDFVTACLACSGLDATGHKARSFALVIDEIPTQVLDETTARAHAEAGAAALERLCLAERTERGIRVHPLAARTLALTDPEPARARSLEKAVLETLLTSADPTDAESAWIRLSPLLVQIRRLVFDQPAVGGDEDDPGIRSRRTRLICVLADIDAARGATREALGEYRLAAERLLRAMTEDPGNGRRQHDYAVIQERMGDLLLEKGDLAEALDCFVKSLGIRTLANRPGSAGRPLQLLRHHEKIGDIQRELGQTDAALQSYRAAHAIIEKLAAKKNAREERRFQLVQSYHRLAGLYREVGNGVAALAALEATDMLLARLRKEEPERPDYVRLQADLDFLLGEELAVRKSHDKARDRYQAALATTKTLTAAEPENVALRRRLADCHDRLGNELASLFDQEAAAAHYRAYIKLLEAGGVEDPGAPPPRELAVAHIKLGIALEGTVPPQPEAALSEYRRASELLELITAASPKHPYLIKDRAWVVRRIKALTERQRYAR